MSFFEYDALMCTSLALGQRLPPNEIHACSVSMPKWDQVIRYEQGCPQIHEALSCGYPRFIYHPSVKRLNAYVREKMVLQGGMSNDTQEEEEEQVGKQKQTLALYTLPSLNVALRCRDFMMHSLDQHDSNLVQMIPLKGCGEATVVSFPKDLEQSFKRFWQHTGEIVSSRYADYLLQRLQLLESNPLHISSLPPRSLRTSSAHDALIQRLAELNVTDPANVFVYPTGMASIFAAKRLMNALTMKLDGHRSSIAVPNQSKSVVFGFPYLDTLKMMQRNEFGKGVHFFPTTEAIDFVALEKILETSRDSSISGIFVEFPGNPLLRTPDIHRLVDLAHRHRVCVVLDDTMASFNLNFVAHSKVDVVVTSLSKIFSATGHVMGGSLIVNERGPRYTELKTYLERWNDRYLFEEDARVLFEASKDLEKRLQRVNETAAAMVHRLGSHVKVKAVYYPAFSSQNVERYQSFVSKARSYPEHRNDVVSFGPVFSFLLYGGEKESQTFYDALTIAKGPSLGLNFTLCCPYTLLAHYDELDFVESCGIDRKLLRVSIGLESVETIWNSFLHGFQALEALESVAGK